MSENHKGVLTGIWLALISIFLMLGVWLPRIARAIEALAVKP